jgi:hypothetical protein
MQRHENGDPPRREIPKKIRRRAKLNELSEIWSWGHLGVQSPKRPHKRETPAKSHACAVSQGNVVRAMSASCGKCLDPSQKQNP